MRILTKCPHCQTRAVARTARQMSSTMKEIYYQCLDVTCGHTFVVSHEVIRTLSPSAKPSADVRLPFSQNVRERVMRQMELIGQ
jgi:hypothetical protein